MWPCLGVGSENVLNLVRECDLGGKPDDQERAQEKDLQLRKWDLEKKKKKTRAEAVGGGSAM